MEMSLFEYIDVMQNPYDIFHTSEVIYPLHWHYYSEVLYILKGSVKIICNNREAILKKGDLCYFYPLQLHRVKQDKNCAEEVDYAVIKFNIPTLEIPKGYLQDMYQCFVYPNEEDFCLILREDEKKIYPVIRNIMEEYESSEKMHMLAVQAGIFTLLIHMARLLSTKEIHPSGHFLPGRGLSSYHILEYLDAHSAEPIEVADLASMCHMSYSNFAKVFRENYGRSCKEYIQYIRLNKAQNLLLNSDFDLDYIAQETGFYDCSYFIRQYKKWRGITPGQEREKMR